MHLCGSSVLLTIFLNYLLFYVYVCNYPDHQCHPILSFYMYSHSKSSFLAIPMHFQQRVLNQRLKIHVFRDKHNTAFVGDSLKHEPVDSTALWSKTAHPVVHFLFEAFLETADFLLQGADVSGEERNGGRRHHCWTLGPLATSCPEKKGGQRSDIYHKSMNAICEI